MDLPVFVQARATAVHLVTLPARILLSYHVHFHVSDEVVTGIKDSSTLIALERLAMNCEMLNEFGVLGEIHAAFSAAERLLRSMTVEMIQ